jgi:4-amino-4-deoxy-L-arabinose transferase-like glycosyltransferase
MNTTCRGDPAWPPVWSVDISLYRAATILIIFGYILLAFGFSQGPIFEGPDEIEHFRYIQTIARTSQLPPPDGQRGGEYHQPPLYYLLNAPLLALLDDTGFDLIDERSNPFYPHEISIPANDNRNLYLHTRASESSPVAQAVHILRLLPLSFGVLTLLSCECLFARLFQPQSVRLLALAVAAFHPQFAYLSSVINNDSLLILLASAVLFLLVDATQRGLTMRRALLLGVICGALLLSKTSGLFVGIVVGLAFALNRSWWRWLPLTGTAALLVAGWWYAHNTLAYHDPFLTEAWRRTWPDDVIENRARAIPLALSRLPFAYQTFWARFGGGAVGLPDAMQRVWDALVVAALTGGVLCLIRNRDRANWRAWLILLTFGAIWILATFYVATIAWSGIQGRYLLPGTSVWSALLASGLMTWIPARARPVTAGSLTFGLAALAFTALFGFFLPAYRPSPPVTDNLAPLNYDYEGTARLIGSQLSAESAAPGELVVVTLTWQALITPSDSLRVYVHAIAPDGSPAQDFIGRNSYPGTGNFLSQDWQAGDTWSEHHLIRIADDAPTQTVYTLVAGLSDAQTDAPLVSTAPNNLPVIGHLAVPGERRDRPDPAYNFGERIGVSIPDITAGEGEFNLCLPWLALDDGTADYQVFVHVFDANGNLIAQHDSPPLRGRYPTRYWRKGERIVDCIMLEADTAADTIAFGLYDSATQTRLPVYQAALELPNGQVILTVEK